jgi:hypothetical protein
MQAPLLNLPPGSRRLFVEHGRPILVAFGNVASGRGEPRRALRAIRNSAGWPAPR